MVVVLFFLLINILFFFSFIKIELNNCKYSNLYKSRIDGRVGIYLFKKIPIITKKLDSNLLEKETSIKEKFSKYINNNMKKGLKLKGLNNIKIYLEKVNLKVNFGTGDVLLTVFSIPIISQIISILVNLKNIRAKKENIYYRINPLYNTEKISYDIRITCIISIKFAHIIIELLKLSRENNIMKESDKFGKTSDRRFNANSHV